MFRRDRLLRHLREMHAQDILIAICEAKTGSKKVYLHALPLITKQETEEQLSLFIRVATEGMAEGEG